MGKGGGGGGAGGAWAYLRQGGGGGGGVTDIHVCGTLNFCNPLVQFLHKIEWTPLVLRLNYLE